MLVSMDASDKVAKNRARVKAWGEANKERKREANRKWMAANREKARAWKIAWREANPDKVAAENERTREANKARSRDYRIANPDKVRQTKAASYQKHKATRLRQTEEARKANPELKRVRVRNRRAAKRQAEGFHTAAETQAIRQAQGNRCAYCKCDLGRRAHLDHIVPLSRGGSNWPSNLQWLCEFCNVSKGAKDPIEFAQQRGLLL
jgi:5-methylcytosine-specific restriction endonuclease McrA